MPMVLQHTRRTATPARDDHFNPAKTRGTVLTGSRSGPRFQPVVGPNLLENVHRHLAGYTYQGEETYATRRGFGTPHVHDEQVQRAVRLLAGARTKRLRPDLARMSSR